MSSSQPSSSPCKTCGKEASLRCGRCANTWYCSSECQKNDWKRHKKTDCRRKAAVVPVPVAAVPVAAAVAAVEVGVGVDLLPRHFIPSDHLFCLHCGRHQTLCVCTDRGSKTPAERLLDLIFTMDPIPAHFTVMQRIQRWALLVSHHPILRLFDAERFVKDLPPSFPQDLEKVKPIISNLMEEYKRNGLEEVGIQLGIPVGFLREGFIEQCMKDCDFVMENFFAGNWGYPTNMEFIFLNNAIQQKDPEEFDDEMRPLVDKVLSCVNIICETYKKIGQSRMEFRLEDIRNITFNF